MNTYICVYLGAAVLGLLLTPMVIRLGRVLKVLDQPGFRKVHTTAVPRLGGLVIAAATLAMILCVLALDNVIGQTFQKSKAQVLAMLGAAVFMFIIGLIDDIRGVRASVKFLAAIAAATVVCAFGIRITSFSVGSWLTVEFGWLAWPITILWIVGITNAVNLIDGLDGLAAGISAIACGVIAAFAIYSGQPMMAVLMLGVLGSLTGFLLFNFNPAKIFMGDSGTYFLGFILASGSILSTVKAGTVVGLALPVLALGVPIFDTLFSMLRRVLQRRSLFAPDRSHVHHRLLDMGLQHRHVVVVIYGLTLLAASLGMFMMLTRDAGTLMVFGGVLLLLAFIFRAIGLVRLRGTLATLQRNLALSRRIKQNKRCFEEAQLMLCEARGFDEWWQALCVAADKLHVARLLLTGDADNENVENVGPLLWQQEGYCRKPRNVLQVRFPCRWAGFIIEIELPIDGCIELAGHRAKLFSRLADDTDGACLQARAGTAQIGKDEFKPRKEAA